MMSKYWRRKYWIISQNGDKCQCGSSDDLDVEYKENSGKLHPGKIYIMNEPRFLEEAKLCEVLCRKCRDAKLLRSLGL